jgi:hypothetical protein
LREGAILLAVASHAPDGVALQGQPHAVGRIGELSGLASFPLLPLGDYEVIWLPPLGSAAPRSAAVRITVDQVATEQTLEFPVFADQAR